MTVEGVERAARWAHLTRVVHDIERRLDEATAQHERHLADVAEADRELAGLEGGLSRLLVRLGGGVEAKRAEEQAARLRAIDRARSVASEVDRLTRRLDATRRELAELDAVAMDISRSRAQLVAAARTTSGPR